MNQSHTTLTQISLLLNGAIRVYEENAPRLYEKVEENEKLAIALKSIAEAMYWACAKADGALLHGIDEASHLPAAK